MADRPELEEFQKRLEALRRHPLLRAVTKGREVRLADLELDEVAALVRDETSYYFLLAAAGFNRTSLKKAAGDAEASIVKPTLRRAFAIKRRLPVRREFADVAASAVALRRGDLDRKSRGSIESLFRDRLAAEGIGILMSPPVRQVPGILVARRKPDGIFPDPATGAPPKVYLEIKNVRRVADDIQKRLYEIAEAALEMKFLYGKLRLEGLALDGVHDVLADPSPMRRQLRARILEADPKVVALFLCAKAEGERYRDGAHAFVDRVFFQEEIDECLAYLASATEGP